MRDEFGSKGSLLGSSVEEGVDIENDCSFVCSLTLVSVNNGVAD